MEIKSKNCVVCGSTDLKLISSKNDGENIFYTYRCLACGETFSTESAFLRKKAKQEQEESRRVAAEKRSREAFEKAVNDAVGAAVNAAMDNAVNAVKSAAENASDEAARAVEKIKSAQKQAEEEQTARQLNSEREKEMSAAEVYAANRKYVVEIFSDFAKDSKRGTGILLGNGYVLTNAHVISENKNGSSYGVIRVNVAENIQCKLSDGDMIELEIVRADVKRDIAVLYSENLQKDGVKFAVGTAVTGSKVFAIGNSKGEGICILDGIISDNTRMINGEKYIMYTAPTVGGNSGGPLFNTKGEAVGMVTLGRKDAALMNYALPVATLFDFLRDAEEKENVKIF